MEPLSLSALPYRVAPLLIIPVPDQQAAETIKGEQCLQRATIVAFGFLFVFHLAGAHESRG